MILVAALWTLAGGGRPVTEFFGRPEVASFLLYLETGRVVHPTEETVPTVTDAPTAPTPPPTQAVLATEPPRLPMAFTAQDGALTEVFNATKYAADVEALVTRPLDWELTQGGPKVLILHTHATESYTQSGERYEETVKFRTLDEAHNMLRVGDALKQVLESYGISVIHDRTLHDYPSYTGSYNSSRRAAEHYLQQYPGIELILDVHRDAVELSSGAQMDTSATVSGQESSQLMLVLGTDAGGLEHPNWQENLSLAVKLQSLLERESPGLMRPLYLRKERFNQDLLPGMLLVEVGAAGNTLQEALTAAEALGHAIAALRYGANTS